MASTRSGYLAIKKEPTTALAVKPTNFIRFKDGDVKYDPNIIANNPIQNNRWNAICAVNGKAKAEGSFNLDLDVNESLHFLAPAVGNIASADISSASDGSVYKHTITLADTLKSITLEQGKGNLTDTSNNRQNYQVDRAFGVLVDNFKVSDGDVLNLSVNLKAHGVLQRAKIIEDVSSGSNVEVKLDSVEGFVAGDNINIFDATPKNEDDTVASIDLAAKSATIATVGDSYEVSKDAKLELLPQTPSYGDCAVMGFSDVAFQFGADLTTAATSEEENVENWEFSFSNNLEERYGSKRNSPSVIAPKGNDATLKFTKYFESVVDRDRFLNKTKQACILTISNNKIVSTTDTNQAKETIKFLKPSVIFPSHEMPTGTDDLYAINAEMQLFHDNTTGAALTMEVINGNSGTTY